MQEEIGTETSAESGTSTSNANSNQEPPQMTGRHDRFSADDLLEVERHNRYLGRRKWMRIAGIAAVVIAAWILSQFTSRGTIMREIAHSSPEEILRLAQQRPNDIPVLMASAFRLMDEGHAPEAQELMERVVKIEPRNSSYWYGLARASGRNGDALRAAEAYRTAIEIDPKSNAARLPLAQTYFEAGLHSDAMELYEQVRATDPKALDKTYIYGECLIILGKPAEGIEHFKRTLMIVPVLDDPFTSLPGAAVKTGRLADAETMCRRRLQFSSLYYYGKVRNALSRLILLQDPSPERLEEAEQMSRRALGDGDSTFDAGLARVLVAQGRLKEARAAAEAGLERDPKHRECLEIAADVSARLGDASYVSRAKSKLNEISRPEAELKPLRDAVKSNPGDRAACLALAAALNRTGRPAEAVEVFRAFPGSSEDTEIRARHLEYRDNALEKLAARPRKPEFVPTFAP